MIRGALPSVLRLLDLSGRTAWVTGAGTGIGAAVALRLAEAGASVVVHYATSIDGANEVVRAIGRDAGRAVALRADLRDALEVSAFAEAAIAELGPPHILVNNAGIFPLHPLLEMRPLDWDNVVDSCLRTAFLCTQAASRRMIEAGHAGAIVNITSIEAVNPAPAHAHYSAAKAGLRMFTRSSAQELGQHGIRVNAVAPGLIHRPGIEQAWPEGVERYRKAAPLGRLGDVVDVADAVLFLASDAARWITGTELTVDGGVLTAQAY
jgi:NAD(P)-dependent dehydrogenase (short-subunit alcohol dehydrogenase family)